MKKCMTAGKPLISVVVPVYQVEAELPRCVESILHQTWEDFELILVNDGSSDNCGTLCDKYAAQDQRVRAIHQENQGLSGARNRGAQEARGQYIAFVDSDDLISPSYLSVLHQGLRTAGAQIAVCGSLSFRGIDPVFPSDKSTFDVCVRTEALKRILYQGAWDVSAWAKLYRSETVRRFPFPRGRVYEDVLTTVQIFCAEQAVAFTDTKLYGYYQRATSIRHEERLDHRLDEAEMTKEMLAYVAQHCPTAWPAALCKAFSNYCQILAHVPKTGEGRALYEEAQQFIKEHAFDVCRDRQARLKNRAAAVLAGISPAIIAQFG